MSIAVKSDLIEVENYNKELESKGKTESKNRLEFRSTRMSSSTTIEEEFTDKWFKRLDKALEQFELVQDRFNDRLAELWQENQSKPTKQRDFINLNGFLVRYKDCIFTRKQLIDLLTRLEVPNPKGKAKNFKDHHTVEFYSKTDLMTVIDVIKQSIIKYFSD